MVVIIFKCLLLCCVFVVGVYWFACFGFAFADRFVCLTMSCVLGRFGLL